METSALEKINIEKAYETIITEIHKKFISLLKDDDDNLILDKENVVDLGSNNKKNFIKKCC